MQFKIDISIFVRYVTHSSENSYYGSIIGETAKNEQWLIDFFHYGEEQLAALKG